MNNKVDYILSSVGIAWSLVDIQNIISIILLTISLLNILWKFGYKIYTKIKEKKFDEIENDIEEAKEEIEKLQNKEE